MRHFWKLPQKENEEGKKTKTTIPKRKAGQKDKRQPQVKKNFCLNNHHSDADSAVAKTKPDNALKFWQWQELNLSPRAVCALFARLINIYLLQTAQHTVREHWPGQCGVVLCCFTCMQCERIQIQLQIQINKPELRFVATVTTGGLVKFVPAV